MLPCISIPLTDVIRKGCPHQFKWSSQREEAFQVLKEQLCSSPVSNSPNFEKDFIVQTGASDRAVGTVLSQLNDQGEEHPIAYFSKRINTV